VERAKIGRQARASVPRSAHAELATPTRDPLHLLETQATDRVPELAEVRYGRMLASPFSFLRGAALLMAHDLAGTPRTGLPLQLCGDVHLANFGLFGTAERRLVFDLNDFDETMTGPWEWDVKRLAASCAVAAGDNDFSVRQRRMVIAACVRRYRLSMREFAGMTNLDVWYARADAEAVGGRFVARLSAAQRRRMTDVVAKARRADSLQAAVNLTRMRHGEPRIIADPPLLVPIDDLRPGIEHSTLLEPLTTLLEDYLVTLRPDRAELLRQYRVVDVAHKVVGVGSVGTRTWIVLLLGRDAGDPLFLQAKAASPSVLSRFLGPSPYAHHGERVVRGQHTMQAASDIFLGWHRADDSGVAGSSDGAGGGLRDYYVRQMRDWKASADIAKMSPGALAWYAELCAWSLARAHARSGDRIAIAAYLGSSESFDRAVTTFAELYAVQNERDYRTLAAAVGSGTLAARNDLRG